MKFSIIKNNYLASIEVEQQLLTILKTKGMEYDEINPDFVFVIGGDGTFLRAVNKYNDKLAQIVFVPFKSGGIGYYTNHNHCSDYDKVAKTDFNQNQQLKEYFLLELEVDQVVSYALNEIKISRDTTPLKIEVNINNDHLETFKGTGLVFATASGSTGYMKATNGAIIYPDLPLYEMNELFPVSTNKFRTINAPIIFSNQQEINLFFDEVDFKIIVDTKQLISTSKELKIKLSEIKLKTLILNDEIIAKTKVIKDLFVLN